MCSKGINPKLKAIVMLIFSVFLLISLFLSPANAADGILRGLALCCNTLIPALFPFFIASRLFLQNPFSSFLGVVLMPYTRLLGIHGKKAPAALLLGLLGGFAGGANAVSTLVQSREITERDASVLLCCTINSGPGFVVSAVGTSLLGSASAGWLMLAALVLASFVSGLLLSFFYPAAKSQAAALPPDTSEHGFIATVRISVENITMLCGFVVFFSFLSAMLTPPHAKDALQYGIALLLEVTNACQIAVSSALAPKLALCCLALSVMGASIFLQVRALVPKSVSLMPLLYSRLLHAPLSLLFLNWLLRLFPISIQTINGGAQLIPHMQMPIDAACVVFLLIATVFCATPLRKAKNSL